MNFKIQEDSKNFYKKMIIIGIPVVFQNLISLSLNLIDTLMIGVLGEQQLAAVGAANQVFFIFNICLFGMFSGAAVYTAQYFGAGDLKGVRRMLGIDYAVGVVFAIFVSVIALLLAPHIISIFSKDQAVIEYGCDYLHIAAYSYIFTAVSMAISYNARAIQNLKVPTIINGLALCINAVLNYFLIFGIGPCPELGVKGAAVATLTARIFESAALLIYIYTRKEHPFKTGLSNLKFSYEMFVKVMKMAVPVVITEGGWATSVALIFAAYGHIGTAALAVVQVANVVTEMMQSFYFGVGNATAMLIGEMLGRGNKEAAYRDAVRSLKIVAVMNIFMTVILMLLSRPIAGIYNFNPETTTLLIKTICTMALIITPRMFGYMFIVGILRAGGDTVYCMKVETMCNLLIHVPIAFFAVMVLHTSLPLAIVLGEAGNLIRILLCWPRFRSRKWINIVTE